MWYKLIIRCIVRIVCIYLACFELYFFSFFFFFFLLRLLLSATNRYHSHRSIWYFSRNHLRICLLLCFCSFLFFFRLLLLSFFAHNIGCNTSFAISICKNNDNSPYILVFCVLFHATFHSNVIKNKTFNIFDLINATIHLQAFQKHSYAKQTLCNLFRCDNRIEKHMIQFNLCRLFAKNCTHYFPIQVPEWLISKNIVFCLGFFSLFSLTGMITGPKIEP